MKVNRMKPVWQFYDRVFAELKAAGIEPLVTIYHNENPFALTQECNGWADRRASTII